MKKVLIILPILLISVLSFSQSCPEYFSMQEGTMWEQQNFNSKNKLESTTNAYIKEYSTTNTGHELLIEIRTVDKRKNELNGTLTYRCENGVLYMDMSDFLQQMNIDLRQYEDMDIEINNDGIQYPSELIPGTTLPDANLTIAISMQGMKIMSVSVDILDRQVVTNESVTVPAGTFDATKISYTLQSKVGFAKTQLSVIEWVSSSSGVVRSETYDKKGKLQDYMVLSKFQTR